MKNIVEFGLLWEKFVDHQANPQMVKIIGFQQSDSALEVKNWGEWLVQPLSFIKIKHSVEVYYVQS